MFSKLLPVSFINCLLCDIRPLIIIVNTRYSTYKSLIFFLLIGSLRNVKHIKSSDQNTESSVTINNPKLNYFCYSEITYIKTIFAESMLSEIRTQAFVLYKTRETYSLILHCGLRSIHISFSRLPSYVNHQILGVTCM